MPYGAGGTPMRPPSGVKAPEGGKIVASARGSFNFEILSTVLVA